MAHLDDRWYVAGGAPSVRHGQGMCYRVRWAEDYRELSRSFSNLEGEDAFLAELRARECAKRAVADDGLLRLTTTSVSAASSDQPRPVLRVQRHAADGEGQRPFPQREHVPAGRAAVAARASLNRSSAHALYLSAAESPGRGCPGLPSCRPDQPSDHCSSRLYLCPLASGHDMSTLFPAPCSRSAAAYPLQGMALLA